MLEMILKKMDDEASIAFLQEMLRYDTTNPPGKEKSLARFMAYHMQEAGMEAFVDDLGDERGNVIGRIKGNGEKKDLFFNGHLDVVPTGDLPWEYPPFAARRVDGKIYGRGASDMKGGLAAMTVAATLVAKAGVKLKGDLILTGSAGEEMDSIGAWDCLHKGYLDQAAAVVISEPTHMEMFTATKGALWLEFTATGKTAHGSMPDCGRNAILMMQAVIERLTQYSFEAAEHSLLTPPTLNISTIKGGVKTNVVPDSCVMTVDMRTVPGQDHKKILLDVDQILTELKKEIPGFACDYRITNDRLPVETGLNNDLIETAVVTGKEVLNKELKPMGVNYYTDASVFVPAKEVPFFLLGPGDEKLAHQPNEFVPERAYLDAIHYYTALILNYLT